MGMRGGPMGMRGGPMGMRGGPMGMRGRRMGSSSGSFNAMGMDFAAQQKAQELEMKKKAEGEPDLGYIGSFSGMKCGELKDVGDRLECHYDKYKYDDPLAKMEIKRKALARKRQGRHGYAIKRMCIEEEPILCAVKDRDDEDKEQEPKCLELNACPEPGTTLNDIIDDTKAFYKLLIEAMNFFKKKKGKKRKKGTKELSKLREKMKKELQQIKEEYDSLNAGKGQGDGGDKGKGKGKGKGGEKPAGASAKSGKPAGVPAKSGEKPAGAPPPPPPQSKGGAMPPELFTKNQLLNIYNSMYRSTAPIDPQSGSGEPPKKSFKKKLKETFISSDKTFAEQTGTASCKGKVARGTFDKDWKNYKKCVLDYQEGAPKDGANIIEQAKQKFSTAPLTPRHLELLERYHKKKKLMEKTTSSAAQKFKALKKKARGKLAAYKVTAQKAKNDAKGIAKTVRGAVAGKSSGAKRTAKNMDSLRKDPGLNKQVNKVASDKANKKLDELNKKRASKGLPPLKKGSEAATNFLKTETAKEKKKLIEDPAKFAKIKKEKLRQDVKDQMKKSGLNSKLVKTSGALIGSRNLRKKLKKMKEMEGNIEQRTQKYMKQGMSKKDASKLAKERIQSKTVRSIGRKGSTKALIQKKAQKMGVNSSMLKTGYFGRKKTLRQLDKTEKLKQRAIATGTSKKDATSYAEARILGKRARSSSIRNSYSKQKNTMSKDIFGTTKALKRSKKMAKRTKELKLELQKAGIKGDKALEVAAASSRAKASGRFFKDKNMKKEAKRVSKEALGLKNTQSGIRYNRIKKFAKKTQDFKKTDLSKALERELMSTGKTKSEAKDLVQNYAMGRAAKKTRKGRNLFLMQKQGRKKQEDRNFAAKTLEALGYNKNTYMTTSKLKNTLKQRQKAKEEIKRAEKIYGKRISNNLRQEFLKNRSLEKISRRGPGGTKVSKTKSRKATENKIHSQMKNKNPGMAERVGNTAFSFGKASKIQQKISKAKALGLSNNVSTRAGIYKGSKRRLFETNRTRKLKEERKKFSKELVGKETSNISALARRSNKRNTEARNIMTTLKNKPGYVEALASKMGSERISKDITFDQARQLAVDGKKGIMKRASEMLLEAEKKRLKAVKKLGINKNENPEVQQRLQKIAMQKQLYKSGLLNEKTYRESKKSELNSIGKQMRQNQLTQMGLNQSNIKETNFKKTKEVKKMMNSFKKSANEIQKQKNSQIKKLTKKGFDQNQATNLAESSASYKKLEARKNVLNKYGTEVAKQTNKEVLEGKKNTKKEIKKEVSLARKDLKSQKKAQEQLRKEQEKKQKKEAEEKAKEQKEQEKTQKKEAEGRAKKQKEQEKKQKKIQKQQEKAKKEAEEKAKKEAEDLARARQEEANRNAVKLRKKELEKEIKKSEYQGRLRESTELSKSQRNRLASNTKGFKQNIQTRKIARNNSRKEARSKMGLGRRKFTLDTTLNAKFEREQLLKRQSKMQEMRNMISRDTTLTEEQKQQKLSDINENRNNLETMSPNQFNNRYNEALV